MSADGAILVVGPRWIGDMVMAQTLFAALKDRQPRAPIDVIAPKWAGPLLARMPEVRDWIDAPFVADRLEFGLRRRIGRALRGRYASAYVLPGSWKSALVPFFARIPRRVGYLREFRYGLLTEPKPLPTDIRRRTAEAFHALAGEASFRNPRLVPDRSNRDALLARHGLAGPAGFAAMMPGAEFGPAKRWPERFYAELAGALMRRGFGIVLLGSAKDAAVTGEVARIAPGAIDLAGKTRLEDAIDILSAARLAVTNDSGLMHVAAAVGVPVVGIYGSTSPDNTPPLTEHRELLTLRLSCSPCHARECPLGHMNCLNQLAPSTVHDAVDRLLAATQAS
ncbi:MAG: lipopolysaccharide heptosyltransferase II [Rhizobiaceae bacterium]